MPVVSSLIVFVWPSVSTYVLSHDVSATITYLSYVLAIVESTVVRLLIVPCQYG